MHLERWKPEVGCCRNGVAPKEAWVRILGLPLHLWIREVLRRLGIAAGLLEVVVGSSTFSIPKGDESGCRNGWRRR